MSEHLSPDEITGFFAGTWHRPDREQHLRECVECRKEVSWFEDVTRQFRKSVTATAQAADGPVPPRIEVVTVRPKHFRRLGWVIPAALAAFAVMMPFYTIRNQKAEISGPQPAVAIRPATDDELLLNSVQSRLSRRVPSAFEPMLQLMSTDWIEANSQNDSLKENSQ
jgi:hypothetical protein